MQKSSLFSVDSKFIQHTVYLCTSMLGYMHISKLVNLSSWYLLGKPVLLFTFDKWATGATEVRVFTKSECSAKHFEFSQDPAFFCIRDSSVPVYRVTPTSPHNTPLHIPVNLFPSPPWYYLRNTRVVPLLVSVFGAMTGSG